MRGLHPQASSLFARVLCVGFLVLVGCLRTAAEPEVESVAGVWHFALDRASEQLHLRGPGEWGSTLPEGDGISQRWYARELGGVIHLPGILQAQGYGDPISVDTPWVLTLGDAWWKLQPESLRAPFSRAGKVRVPFLSQPPRHYLGAAWYQRKIIIPATWAGRPLRLFLERPHWETRVWVDDKGFPADQGLVAPHIVDLGVLSVGPHRLTIRVDNRELWSDPKGNQHMNDAHSVSDQLGAAWNGIVGRMELQALGKARVEAIRAYPDVSSRSVRLHVEIGASAAGRGMVSAGGISQTVEWGNAGGEADLTVPLAPGVPLWDEFHPGLQHLSVVLTSGEVRDVKAVAFGLREVAARGKELLINGRVVNLRMTHFGGDFPVTGTPPTDVPAWEHIYRVCQAHGLNGMRFHSWCPPEAAFEAADRVGFYLQPECGFWSPFSPGNLYTGILEDETRRLLDAYGNHPSFILLSPSNEPGGHYQQVTPAWAARWYARDPRRLYSAGTGWSDPAQVTGGAQYASLVRYGSGELRNQSGWFGRDYAVAMQSATIPVIAHEVGQWCAYPDFGVMKSFNGAYLEPGNYEIFRVIAANQGVLEENARFAHASGRFQLACYKEDIEANLRTPGLSGFALLDLHDYLGQGTALIGVLDAFWNPKSYVDAREFRRFAGPVVPLARLSRRVFTTDDSLEADVELYNFGDAPIQGHNAIWRLTDAKGRVLVQGVFEPRVFPRGKNVPLGHISVPLFSVLKAPAMCRLDVSIPGTQVANDWPLWVYPPVGEPFERPFITVTKDWDEASALLKKGGDVLYMPQARLDPSTCPPMRSVPVFWNIQMTVRPPRNPTPRFDAMLGLLCEKDHPALLRFPTEESCDWEWTPLIDGVRAVNLNRAPRALKPIVACIDDWNRDWRLGVVFEVRVGKGRLLVSAIDLDQATPGARQLRRSLIEYMGGAAFAPAVSLSLEDLSALWPAAPEAPQPEARRALDPDLDDGSARRVRAP